jgi:hypothetical protein
MFGSKDMTTWRRSLNYVGRDRICWVFLMIPDTYFKADRVEFCRGSEGYRGSLTRNPERVYKFLKGVDFERI